MVLQSDDSGVRQMGVQGELHHLTPKTLKHYRVLQSVNKVLQRLLCYNGVQMVLLWCQSENWNGVTVVLQQSQSVIRPNE
jgi:hypothetical protein